MAKTCNVALIGQGFMGRTHSNAYLKVSKFFTDLPVNPVMHTVFGMENENPQVFASRWGWKNYSTDWKKVIANEEIDFVDIVTPNHMHMPPAMAALEAKKPVGTEKPIAGTLADARAMVEAAKKAKVPTFVWYNYRRCPAVALAHQLVKAGKLGRIFHVRCVYLQDWGGPDTPLLWRFQKKLAGSGAHGDLNAHIVDMARFVTGDDIVEVSGAVAETFIKERTIPTTGAAGGIAAGAKGSAKKGKVDVDDAVLFLARFKKGAVASFECSRLATGYKNQNGFEIHGEKGALRFRFENMNYLDYYDATVDPKIQGWTSIICTSGANHPYVSAWWPDAHILGYEHGFVNQAADIMMVLGKKTPTVPLPDFADAYETQRVLEAALLSAANRTPIKISEVK
ncbi:MAG TPA: Gfo/Idh/MocA family oxidoreductase [Phycisphaerae bacterium]|nr:Gfo/Idh/MocA family oxidoreductase [Phycisphaerae bacterium]HOJ72930.1 Gfo/Idh/MocA family oxidoreductase [Phycisphaerae bacterium]HOM50114.1 Gfo/Idh/MocA family oxidoreductase [Phycisphaerae bacterium]HON67856.1 Gfo/Idh/MocA family oxidoreductase [Phycisphaerae bacterium]HOQ86644.1 Gfo/Idh/MocA family oxidoreductase [Phycisphaerae bacterium]